MEKILLEKYVPPGISVIREVKIMVSGILLAVLYSFSFFFQYMQAKNALYEIYAGNKYLIKNAVICRFGEVSKGCFHGFWIYILCMIGIIIYHYIYHFQGSKLIYFMRRLPNKWEFHKRCLLLPVIAIIIGMITMIVLRFVYYGVYFLCTPYECLPI
ncbi:MAG: hypothetical protein IKJ01_03330 [Lachnospiraceae bacterium]|nr:hypothetical protein [Lachnospiraceae bacterium]